MTAIRVRRLIDLSRAEAHVELPLERESGECHEHHHDAGVHDVAAVSAAIARDESHERFRERFAMNRSSRADALREFLHDRRADECGEDV